MSFIVAAVFVGGALAKGIAAEGNKGDVRRAEAGAYDIYQGKLDLLGERKDLDLSANRSQFSGAQRDVGFNLQSSLGGITASGDAARSQSNLATSGTIEQKVKIQTGDLMAKYKSDMQKLLETRDLERSQADLSFRSGEMSAEESYQNTLTGLSGTPTTFEEGFLS